MIKCATVDVLLEVYHVFIRGNDKKHLGEMS